MELKERVTAVEESTKSAHYRLDKMEKNQEILLEMNSNIRVLAEQNKQQNAKIDRIENDVSDLKEKPAKRWDLVATSLITTIITALVTAFVTGVFK